MKRILITLEAISERKNLVLALHKAARGKRHRSDVQAFFHNMDANLNRLGRDICQLRLPYGLFRTFEIHDPKKRLIHAACFEDRVFHHALMNLAGEVLERAMMPQSFACRRGMGVHKAAKKVQQLLCRNTWYGKIDIDGYFASIPHGRLLEVLLRRYKGEACIAQFKRIIASYQSGPETGLPIGSLTSQYFANYYLDGLDRLLSASTLVKGHVRYMDDVIWWGDDRQSVRDVLQFLVEWLWRERTLKIKPNAQIQPSSHGVTYCGFRVLRGAMRLSRRRKRRYQQRRLYWEQLCRHGEISPQQLQRAYAGVQAITAQTDSRAWRIENLRRHPAYAV
ncbi:Retron-type reverse transcriptase [Nitrosomonas sp. Nm51]|uniref:RNA-directed DNA polymerase n=1 Tax=Nitrosomonas sp. Nm51 TaxID=133720 RepID=UPI0008CF7671|nr:RNA-directed DNA polymerase [Nitrosomonas sp. Nm51]SEQ78978.1 Retron-type reverse transcriptase [Nitrosomonas sp. Nm51]